ncbi:hypothetical protein NUSPORA_00744 [Nucleospora cyclopteri]
MSQTNSLEMQQKITKISDALLDPNKTVLILNKHPYSLECAFRQTNIEYNKENRLKLFQHLLSSKVIKESVSGVILHHSYFDEIKDTQFFKEIKSTLKFGINLDKNGTYWDNGEEIRQGIEDLKNRLKNYKEVIDFAVWETVFYAAKIPKSMKSNHKKNLRDDPDYYEDVEYLVYPNSDNTGFKFQKIIEEIPTSYNIEMNSRIMGKFVKICQDNEILPVLQPDIIYRGRYSARRTIQVTKNVYSNMFQRINTYNGFIGGIIVRLPIISDFEEPFDPDEVAKNTLDTLFDVLPVNAKKIIFSAYGYSKNEFNSIYSSLMKLNTVNIKICLCYEQDILSEFISHWLGKDENIPKAVENMKKMLTL